jgi:hypothetical protein
MCTSTVLLAQHPPHVVAQRLDLLPAHVVGIDLQEKIRSALQIEAKHDVTLGPGWPLLHRAVGKEIGRRAQADQECREQDCGRLRARNVKHRS